jgi:hypothetical protein
VSIPATTRNKNRNAKRRYLRILPEMLIPIAKMIVMTTPKTRLGETGEGGILPGSSSTPMAEGVLFIRKWQRISKFAMVEGTCIVSSLVEILNCIKVVIV